MQEFPLIQEDEGVNNIGSNRVEEHVQEYMANDMSNSGIKEATSAFLHYVNSFCG